VTLNDFEWLFYVKFYFAPMSIVYSSKALLSELGYSQTGSEYR